MQKVRGLFKTEAYGLKTFTGLTSLMLMLFVAGAVLLSFGWGRRPGFIVMAAGLLVSMFIWAVFIDQP